METGKSDLADKKEVAKGLFYEFCGTCLVVYAFNLTGYNYLPRAWAYFIGYMIAVNVSGAHFNPATSLAVYITEAKYSENLKYLLILMGVQFMGGLAGLLMTYLLARNYLNYTLYPGHGGGGSS
jgi:glycerol uptake facilitator-like aquaporin